MQSCMNAAAAAAADGDLEGSLAEQALALLNALDDAVNAAGAAGAGGAAAAAAEGGMAMGNANIALGLGANAPGVGAAVAAGNPGNIVSSGCGWG